MPLARTPPRAQPSPTNIMNSEIITELRDTISDKIKLSTLNSIMNICLISPNSRSNFPFHLAHNDVLNIFSVKSPLTTQMAEILQGTSYTSRNITVHELLIYIAEALEELITNPIITNNPRETSKILHESMYEVESGPQLIKAATGDQDASMTTYLTKAKILFQELAEICSMLRTQGTIWHQAYFTMTNMMDSYNKYLTELDIDNEHPANFGKVQKEFHGQLTNLEKTTKPYNENISHSENIFSQTFKAVSNSLQPLI